MRGVFLLTIVAFASAIASSRAEEAPPADKSKPATADGFGSKLRRALDEMLPTAMQKHPRVHFNVITEMSPEGRRRPAPTPDKPLYYFANPPRYAQMGWTTVAGEKPPPAAELEEQLRQALAANGYVPMPATRQRPDVIISFTFGSYGADPAELATGDESASLPTTPQELVTFVVRDPALFKDVFERARFVAGEDFARELKAAIDAEISNMRMNQTLGRLPGIDPSSLLPVGTDMGSPIDVFLHGNRREQAENFADLAFTTCYYVTATAYDFAAMENRQRVLLWRTRMTVRAQGVAMREILAPMIFYTGDWLGRETPEVKVIDKRLNREGRVEVGTPTVVEEPKSATPSAPPDRR